VKIREGWLRRRALREETEPAALGDKWPNQGCVLTTAIGTLIGMTMNVYGHVSLDDKRDALDKPGTLFEEDWDDLVAVPRCGKRRSVPHRPPRWPGPESTEPQVTGDEPGALCERARRDSNPQPFDP
jgi:hypothetical protein